MKNPWLLAGLVAGLSVFLAPAPAGAAAGPLFDQQPPQALPGPYERLKELFEAATLPPSIARFPVEDAPGLQCVQVDPKGAFVEVKVIRLPKTAPAHGPLFPATVEDKLFTYGYGSGTSKYHAKVEQQIGPTEITVHLPEDSNYSGSPWTMVLRSGEYVFFSHTRQGGPLSCGYCWNP